MIQRFGNLVREADLGAFDVIVHGCNCQATMGAGIAKTIKDRWPSVYERDRATFLADGAVLGNISQEIVTTQSGRELIVVNGYTQWIPGGSARPADYEAIAKVFEKVNMNYQGKRVGIPLIGCGLAGGNWKIVEVMAEELMKDVDLTVIHFPEDNYMMQVAIHGKITSNDDGIFYEYDGERFASSKIGFLPWK